MAATIKNKTEDSVTIEVTIPLSKTMLACEEQITSALNEAGCLAAQSALEQFDTDGSPILLGESKWTARGKFNKIYQTIWGEVKVARYTYQSSKGGRQFCPLEKEARIILIRDTGFCQVGFLEIRGIGLQPCFI